MANPTNAVLRARKVEVKMASDNYGVVDFDVQDDAEPGNRFGIGSSPLQMTDDGKPGDPGEDADCACVKKLPPPIKLFENNLTADTVTTATLEEWVDLPGMTRTITVTKPSRAHVMANVVLQCLDEGDVSLAECRVRIIANDVETSGHTRVSFTPAYIKMAGKDVKSLRTVPCQAVHSMRKNKPYTYKVQISNFGALTTFTALMGTNGGESDTNMVTVVYLGIVNEDPTNPFAEDKNWVRVLDVNYDPATDHLLILRIRGEYDDETPASATIPDRAFIEIASLSASLVTADFPAISVLRSKNSDAGDNTLAIRWKKAIDPATWDDYWSVAFGVGPQGQAAICWSRGQAGATIYSWKFHRALISSGGAEVFYESWDGPNWLENFDAQHSGSIRGSAKFFDGKCYMVIPTTDTTDKSSSDPRKCGWRLVTMNSTPADSGGATMDSAGKIIATYIIAPSGTHKWRMPIALNKVSSTLHLQYREKESSLDFPLYTEDLTGMSGGGPFTPTEIEMGGFLPQTGHNLIVYNNTLIDGYVWMFIQGGYGAVFTWNSWEPTAETWNDELYNADPEYVHWGLASSGAENGTAGIWMFRLAEGGARTEPWIFKVEFNQ